MKIDRKRLALKTGSLLLLVAVCIVGYFFRNTFLEQLHHAKYSWVIAGLLFYFINYLARASRLLLVISGGSIRFLPALTTVSLHGLLSYILPFKTGELSLPLFLNKQGVSMQHAFSVLIKCRLLDLSCLGTLLVLSLLMTESSLDIPLLLVFGIIGMFLAAIPILILLFVKVIPSGWLGWFSRHRFDAFFLARFSLAEYLISLSVWIDIAMSLYCVVQALGLPLSFSDTMCLVAIQLPLQLVPLQGVAGTGNHEASWVTGLALFGIPASDGIAFALSSHIILAFYVCALGSTALLLFIFHPPKNHRLD